MRLGAAVGQRHIAEQIDLPDDDGASRHVTANFMGLTGPAGVLPEHYTERIVDHRRDRDPVPGEFFDLFNHRALSHFWRAWAKYRLPVVFEAGGDETDGFSRALRALAGLGVAGETVTDEALLSMAGVFGRRVRSASALRRIVAGVYCLPVEIIELQGRWIAIAEGDQTRLNSGGNEGGFATLGHDMVAGAAIWDVGSRFRVRIGPLDFADFSSFFASDGPRAAMTETIRRAVGGNIDFDIQLVLRREDVPMLRLNDAAKPAALGQSTWLLNTPTMSDRDEPILSSRVD